jgi:hypothetical protein
MFLMQEATLGPRSTDILDNGGIICRQVDASIKGFNIVTKKRQWNLVSAVSFVRASNMWR